MIDSRCSADGVLGSLRSELEQLLLKAEAAAAAHPSSSLKVFARRLGDVCRSAGEDDGSQVDWLAFGGLLRKHRVAADISQKELAAFVGVSDSYIRAFEAGSRRPPTKTLMRILSVRQLGLSLDSLAPPAPEGVEPTLWLAPDYDPREMLAELCDRLSSAGCSLEQTFAYLDTASASDYLTLTTATPSVGGQQAVRQIAKTLASRVESEWLDVIALGCGAAAREVSLVQELLREWSGKFRIRLLLLDISHALITQAYKHACMALGSSVRIIAMQGNFHDLAQYPLFGERGRARLFTMLGFTLANLDNEVRFFRDSLGGAGRGDYFLLDYTQGFASPDRLGDIEQLDPALRLIPEAQKRWLTGIFRRYCRDFSGVDIHLEVNTDSLLRGCYELLYVARVADRAGGVRRFVVQRVRRYDGAELEAALSRHGWPAVKRVVNWPQGSNRCDLVLLRRDPIPLDARARDALAACRGESSPSAE